MNSDPQPLWNFIPLSKFSPPSEPATQTVRNHLRDLADRLHFPIFGKRKDDPSELEQELEKIPHSLVEKAAPEANWPAIYQQALATAYDAWMKADDDAAGIRVVVGAPGSCLRQGVTAWAIANRWEVIAAPTPQQVLNNGEGWLEQWHTPKARRWVLPSLERSFLRHHHGLNLLRGWLDLVSTQPAGVVVCDSWAWSFLSHTIQLDQLLRNVQTVAPLDSEALEQWFLQLASITSNVEYTFRQANSGQLVCRQGGAQKSNGETNFLKQLAARSRGIPAIAWHIWRHSLLVESVGAIDEKAEEKASSDQGRTIWVRSWDKIELPLIPRTVGRQEAFILHALLLHDGLPDSLLSRLLPLMPFEIAAGIQRLQAANLITADGDCRRVTPLGYPDVREFLQSEGFLSDDL